MIPRRDQRERSALEFQASNLLTVGVELELQLIDRRTGDLTRGASDLIALVSKKPFPGEIKPEITESMLEISTSIHRSFAPLAAELVAMRDTLVAGADRLDIEVAGGGAHPFQRWYDRQIYDRPRFRHVGRFVRLSGKAVHRLRAARSYRLREWYAGVVAAASAVHLHPAVHRAGSGEPVLSGRRYVVRLLAPEQRVCVSAVGPRTIPDRLACVRALFCAS